MKKINFNQQKAWIVYQLPYTNSERNWTRYSNRLYLVEGKPTNLGPPND